MTESDLLHQLFDSGRRISDDEIRKALEFLRDELKGRLKEQATLAAMTLRPGDWVEMIKTVRQLPAGARGHVTAIRRDKIDVHFTAFECYTMPAGEMTGWNNPRATVIQTEDDDAFRLLMVGSGRSDRRARRRVGHWSSA